MNRWLKRGVETGAITAMLTNPIWVVKTRVFGTAKNDRAGYRGLWGGSPIRPSALPLLLPRRRDSWGLDGLRSIYRQEGLRGLYKGSLLALVGVSNGSIQFAAYEEIKRRRTDMKRRRFDKLGRRWRTEDEKLVGNSTVSTED